MKHTPGPLRLCNDGECSCLQIWTADHPVAVVEHGEWGDSYPALRLISSSIEGKYEVYTEHIVYGEIPPKLAKANAKRLVACWNACEGINPEAVPGLLEALEYDGEQGNPKIMSLLNAAADVLNTLAPSIATDLREKAKRERAAIAKAGR